MKFPELNLQDPIDAVCALDKLKELGVVPPRALDQISRAIRVKYRDELKVLERHIKKQEAIENNLKPSGV